MDLGKMNLRMLQVPQLSIYINKNVNVRLCKILNRVQKCKSSKVVHRWLCNFDTTLQSNMRVFLYTYYIYRYKNMLLCFYVQ
jgi:hypothetical protein